MGLLYDTLVNLAPEHDPEMLNGYRRYESLLATSVTPEQMEAYATHIQQSGEIRILEDLTPAELASLPPDVIAVATTVLADTEISMENRRVVALLSQRGESDIIPDFDTRNQTKFE